jgi:hypothetical protein
MKWSIIQKTANPTVEAYGYRDRRVKEFLRKEGGFRCVYCAVHENALGGVQAFHVEHYRPKSRFSSLEHSLANLFYACPVCNRFKSNDWPAEPLATFGNCSYPDPSQVDYSCLFQVDCKSGSVTGTHVASKYVVERLYFNRPHLILERKHFFLSQELGALMKQCKQVIRDLKARGDASSLKYLAKLAETGTQLADLVVKAQSIPLYETTDVSRKRK